MKTQAVRLLIIAGGLVMIILALSSNLPQRDKSLPRKSVILVEDIVEKTQSLSNNSPFEGFNNVTGTLDGSYIVPNIVHQIRFGQNNLSFVDAVCLLSIIKNHKPDKIVFHIDAIDLIGPYWEKVKSTPGFTYEIRKVSLPDTIFGQKFSRNSHVWHAGDVTRIRILMEEGGIFLDNDVYVVKNLDKYRKFEMALGWDENESLGTQILFANKDARFLKLWLESYRQYYPDQWYYNAGVKPTREVLWKRPELVHRVKLLFGVHMEIISLLYTKNWKNWREQDTIHLFIRHRPFKDKWPYFDENNIKKYDKTFGYMAREAYGIE